MGDHGACEGCYARHLSETRMHRVVFGGPGRGIGTRDVRAESAWKEPLKWDREVAALKRAWEAGPDGGMGRPYPYRPFIFPSMCDPFDNHPALREPRRRFFDLIRATPHLTWLLLTKRPGNIVKLWAETFADESGAPVALTPDFWPRNAAIGCTVVTQEEADRDIPHLLRAKAALQPAFAFLSMEPLLGPVDLTRWLPLGPPATGTSCWAPKFFMTRCEHCGWLGSSQLCGTASNGDDADVVCPNCERIFLADEIEPLDWVITGGETDQGKHRARPTHPDWLRSIRDHCAAGGVPYHHKQNGEWVPTGESIGFWPTDAKGHVRLTREGTLEDHGWPMQRVGKKHAGRLLDGVLHDAMPAVS